jgi:hypothetical protein
MRLAFVCSSASNRFFSASWDCAALLKVAMMGISRHIGKRGNQVSYRSQVLQLLRFLAEGFGELADLCRQHLVLPVDLVHGDRLFL